MPIKVKFNENSIRELYKKAGKNAINIVSEALDLALLSAVERARSSPEYLNQTGNLRSSLGYTVFYQGLKVGESYKKFSGPSGDGSEGITKSRNLAENIAMKHNSESTMVGVIVAGMEYAIYLEAKGKDVLTGATLILESEFKKLVIRGAQEYGVNIKFK